MLIGIRYYSLLQEAPKPLYEVLFDMVGDSDLRIPREGNSAIGAPEVVSLVWDVARTRGYGGVFVDDLGTALTDDHVELQMVGIRANDVDDFQYPHGHTPNDTMDKIRARRLGIVGDVALALIQRAE